MSDSLLSDGRGGGQVSGEGWHTNWIFVPGYENAYAPCGIWTAKELWTPTNYYDNQDEGDDMGGAVINTNAYGQHIVNVVGGQGIAWNYPNDQFVYDFGYPAEAPFNGATLEYCTGSEFNWSGIANTMGLPCNFTGGSSGGPWLMSFSGEFGYVNGVKRLRLLVAAGLHLRRLLRQQRRLALRRDGQSLAPRRSKVPRRARVT